MDKEEQILHSRLDELARICYQRNIPTYSDFLNLNEQTVFYRMVSALPPVRYELNGGFESAERKIVCFLPVDSYFEARPPITALYVYPSARKFAQECGHRDYLGAVMNLGIDRRKIGDLSVNGDGCRMICSESMADYILDNLLMVRHTAMARERMELADFESFISMEEIEGSVASVRLDSILSVAFKGSRSQMAELIQGEKVFVNGRCVISNSYVPKEGEIISLRGKGKFVFGGIKAETRKGRYFVTIKKYR